LLAAEGRSVEEVAGDYRAWIRSSFLDLAKGFKGPAETLRTAWHAHPGSQTLFPEESHKSALVLAAARSCCTSRIGGAPKTLLYSRLK
jgi:hypothetical protein